MAVLQSTELCHYANDGLADTCLRYCFSSIPCQNPEIHKKESGSLQCPRVCATWQLFLSSALGPPYHWLGSVFRPHASCGGHFSSVDESQFIIHDTDEPFPRRIFSFVSWRPSITALAEALRLPDGCWQITNIRQLFVLSLIFVV